MQSWLVISPGDTQIVSGDLQIQAWLEVDSKVPNLC